MGGCIKFVFFFLDLQETESVEAFFTHKEKKDKKCQVMKRLQKLKERI